MSQEKIIILLMVLLIPLFLGIDANASSPKKPEPIKYTTGNFWINFTWSIEKDTDSFNISVNGKWTNGTKDTFMNVTTVPHGIVNMALAGYNDKSKKLSEFKYASAQTPNNPIMITKVKNNYSLSENEILHIDADYIDIDNDIGIFSTTATKGTFNTSTGIFSWRPVFGDRGNYKWKINVIDVNNSVDLKSSMSSQVFTVTVYPNTHKNSTNLASSTANFGIRFIEPGVVNDNGVWNEVWQDATVGHIGKFIGIDGFFKNTGEESLTFAVTDNPAKYCPESCSFALSPGESKTFMQAFWGRRDFEINSSDINPDGFLNYTLK